MKFSSKKKLAPQVWVSALAFICLGNAAAETQNSVVLTVPQIFTGQTGDFSVTNSSGPAAVASGNFDVTYSGLSNFTMTRASGRYQGYEGNIYPGIQFGPFQFFRSFLTQNYFTIASASTSCPEATTYNFLNIRVRTLDANRGAMDARYPLFVAGGTIDYDPSSSPVFNLTSTFDLAGPTLNASPGATYDEWNSQPCADGTMLVSATGSNLLDDYGTFWFADQSFVYLSDFGNPLVAFGVEQQTLSAGTMSGLSSSVFSGLYTKYVSKTAQTQTGIYLYPDSNGTTFTLYSIDDVNDPTSRTNYGTLTCTSLNSPTTGFCSGTLSVTGESGTGNAVCLLSTQAPEPLLSCLAQDPQTPQDAVSIIAHVPIKSVLAVSLSSSAVTAAVNGTTTLTATLTNMTGRPISSMGDPSSGALKLVAPFSDAGQYGGGGGSACGSSLAGYASCTVTITYHPTSVGTTKEVFRVAYSDGFFGTVNATANIIGYAGLVSLTISPSTASFSSGSSVQYVATAHYSDSSTADVTAFVNWSLNNNNATISSTGVVTFTGTGSTQVTAMLGSTSANQPVSQTLSPLQVLGQSTPNNLDNAVAGLSGSQYSAVFATQYFLSDSANNRVLIYNSLPTGNEQASDIVVGQPDFNTFAANSGGISATTLSTPRGVATDGTRLVVADYANNRVLIWNTIPTNDQQAADLVLGQPDFSSSAANNGGISASSLSGPIGVTLSSADVLYVADNGNNRVLVWSTFPTANGQAANLVLGQTSFSASSANGGGTTSGTVLSGPTGIDFDGTYLFVADTGNNRVLFWSSAPASSGQTATYVFGQTGLTGNTTGISSTTLSGPTDVASDGSNVLIADKSNNRILVFNSIPTGNQPTANHVLGQSSFTTKTLNKGGISASSLSGPNGVATDGTNVFVCDTGNNRVEIFSSMPTTNFKAADLELGQPNFVSSTANNTGTPAATNFFLPSAVHSDGTHLFVADTQNNRVLIWNTLPTTTDQAADYVLGQPDMASNTANNGGISAQSLSGPQGVYSDGTKLFVADTKNNRVLIWNTIPASNQAAANVVLGQANFTSGTAGTISATVLKLPAGVYSTGTELFVADTGFNRVLGWLAIPTTNQTAADFALGQRLLTTKAKSVAANRMSGPTMVHGDGANLYVADAGNNRVLAYVGGYPSATNVSASYALGQPALNVNTANNGGLGNSSLSDPTGVYTDGTRVFVADKGNNRVLVYGSVPSQNQPAASYVIGQPSMAGGSANNGSLSAVTLYGPFGVYADGSRVWTADTNNGRVLVTPYLATLGFSSSSTYDFGFTNLGGTSTQTFTLYNYGMQSASSIAAGTPALSSPFTYDGGSFSGGTCASSLSGNSTCTVVVDYSPTSALETSSDTVRVSYSNGVSTQVAAQSVQGEAIPVAALTFTDGGSYNFGSVNVGNALAHVFTVSNASGVTATLLQDNAGSSISSAFVYTGPTANYPGGGSCGTVIATGTTCTVSVSFNPLATGLSNSSLSLSYFNGNTSTSVSISLSGTGQ